MVAQRVVKLVSYSLLVIAALLVSHVGAQLSGEPIQIGYVGGLSGGTAAFGVPALEGVQFAVDEMNAAGGIAGRPVELVPFDDQGDPFNAQQGISRLAAQGVSFIVSGSSSAGALAQVPRAYESSVVIITPLGSDPAITAENDEYEGAPAVFANIPNNTVLGSSVADYASERLGVQSVAVFIRDDAYGQSIAAGFEQSAREHGVDIVRRVTYPVTAQDFSSDIAVILASSPDAIFLSGYAADSGLIARQARLYGFSGQLLGTNPLTSPQYAEVAADAGNGTYVSTALNMGEERSAEEVAFQETWLAAKGIAPSAYHLGAYDSVHLFKLAIEAVGEDVVAVREHLAGLRDYSGVSGSITFNDDGSAEKPVFIVLMQGGTWSLVD